MAFIFSPDAASHPMLYIGSFDCAVQGIGHVENQLVFGPCFLDFRTQASNDSKDADKFAVDQQGIEPDSTPDRTRMDLLYLG